MKKITLRVKALISAAILPISFVAANAEPKSFISFSTATIDNATNGRFIGVSDQRLNFYFNESFEISDSYQIHFYNAADLVNKDYSSATNSDFGENFVVAVSTSNSIATLRADFVGNYDKTVANTPGANVSMIRTLGLIDSGYYHPTQMAFGSGVITAMNGPHRTLHGTHVTHEISSPIVAKLSASGQLDLGLSIGGADVEYAVSYGTVFQGGEEYAVALSYSAPVSGVYEGMMSFYGSIENISQDAVSGSVTRDSGSSDSLTLGAAYDSDRFVASVAYETGEYSIGRIGRSSDNFTGYVNLELIENINLSAFAGFFRMAYGLAGNPKTNREIMQVSVALSYDDPLGVEYFVALGATERDNIKNGSVASTYDQSLVRAGIVYSF